MSFRWVFRGAGASWTVPINPDAMTSLFPEKALTAKYTTAGKVLLFESSQQPANWQFSGAILDADHYEGLRHWTYDVPGRIEITDHYGRRIDCALQSFAPEPKRGNGQRPWRHTYTVRALVFRVTAPTSGGSYNSPSPGTSDSGYSPTPGTGSGTGTGTGTGTGGGTGTIIDIDDSGLGKPHA
jgi:hypothetical protein